MEKTSLCFLCALCAFAVVVCSQTGAAQQRPLQTDDAQLLASGQMRLQAGFELLQNQTFSLSGLQGDPARLGVVGLFIGAGSFAEFQATGVVRNRLSIDRRFPAFGSPQLQIKGNTTSDVGDFMLGAKFRLLEEQGAIPALAFRFAAELPNGSNAKGLSNNQNNFYASLLVGKSKGRFRGFANAGVAILDNPTSVRSQKDLFTYGVAATYQVDRRWTLLGEINGRTGPGGAGTNDQSQLRLGAQMQAVGLRWDIAGVAGLAKEDPDFGLAFGLAYEFRAFRKE